MIWLAVGGGLFALGSLFVLALCKAAARNDALAASFRAQIEAHEAGR